MAERGGEYRKATVSHTAAQSMDYSTDSDHKFRMHGDPAEPPFRAWSLLQLWMTQIALCDFTIPYLKSLLDGSLHHKGF
jgi:hypothetical protein